MYCSMALCCCCVVQRFYNFVDTLPPSPDTMLINWFLYVIEDFTVIKYICQGNIQKINLHIQWIPLINMATPTDKVEQSTGPLPQNFLLLPCVFVAWQVGASVQALLAVRKNTAMLLQKFWSSCNTYHTLLLKASQSGSFSVKPSIHEMHFSDMFINQYIQ